MKLEVVIEDIRCDEVDENPTQSTADGDGEIEVGEKPWSRFESDDFSVTCET